MNTQRLRTIYTISLVILDALLISVAFVLAHQLRTNIPWPDELTYDLPLSSYAGLLALQIVVIITTMSFFGLYYIPRSFSRVDQGYHVFVGVTIGALIAVALANFIFKGDSSFLDFPRAMIVYAWLLSIILIVLGRVLHRIVRNWLRVRGIGKDRLLLVGTGEMARVILQRILWSPDLGYEVIGVINGTNEKSILGIPVLGTPEDLPRLIEYHAIDEVIIAIPEKGHRETIRVLDYCERGRVSIKIFPDVFQFVTNKASIDALGGLPLLSVRDYAMRGYLLIFKRLIDFIGAGVGLVLLSPLMLLVAVAIKLESPGPAFFVQERMGLDGKPFMMLKFRSMRRDAEKDGPGWTTDNDPRQTKLGALLRRIEIDELPNLINVLIGEMSLVGPRPEQAHYVAQFREIIPRYMDRHREKGGMTGWAQVNGLRGDTSITERTKYDLWYSENWSIWLDLKIVIRTLWQIAERKNEQRAGRDFQPAPMPEEQISLASVNGPAFTETGAEGAEVPVGQEEV